MTEGEFVPNPWERRGKDSIVMSELSLNCYIYSTEHKLVSEHEAKALDSLVKMRSTFAVVIALSAGVATAVFSPPNCPLGSEACTLKTTTFLGKPTTITDCGPCSSPTGPTS